MKKNDVIIKELKEAKETLEAELLTFQEQYTVFDLIKFEYGIDIDSIYHQEHFKTMLIKEFKNKP